MKLSKAVLQAVPLKHKFSTDKLKTLSLKIMSHGDYGVSTFTPFANHLKNACCSQ